jgi:precorrin-2 dehydrogenase/sirohydrochlorin ferrochelatase
MEMLPIYLKLEGRPCLVVGAGTIAAPKIDSLVRTGAVVTVVAPRALPVVRQQAADGQICWVARDFVPADLHGMFLVITGTDIRAVNHAVAEQARGGGILCNSVDDPPDCDFFYPSVVRRGDLQIAISTAGKSPALAQRLRAEIDALLPEDAGRWLDELGELRLRILEAFPLSDQRKRALHLLARRESCDPAACPVHALLDRIAQEAVSQQERESEPESEPKNLSQSSPVESGNRGAWR